MSEIMQWELYTDKDFGRLGGEPDGQPHSTWLGDAPGACANVDPLTFEWRVGVAELDGVVRFYHGTAGSVELAKRLVEHKFVAMVCRKALKEVQL